MLDDAIEPRLPSPTATLVDADLVGDAYGQFLVGTVYADAYGRWADGTRIHTSRIFERLDATTFHTIAGSLFRVSSWSVKEVPVEDGFEEIAL